MSAAGIRVTTTTKNAMMAAASDEDGMSRTNSIKSIETDGTPNSENTEEKSAFSTLQSLNELQSSLYHDESYHNTVPLENLKPNVHNLPENEAKCLTSNSNLHDFPNCHLGQIDIESTTTQISPGLNLLHQTAAASSPPPHSYRHSRAYRHFKNPPQPHMCIRTTTEAGEELFINVLSWTRIVIPQEPSDPIPLYGGMRVPPGSPRSPPIVFAVMANPEVLKDSGRHSKDPEERRAMVELMCDFVEAMNPGIKLVRNAIILKDRDISGELKDVWNAVQAQRDREREEQILLQRQQHQQHFHNLSSASTNGTSISSPLASTNNPATVTLTTQQMFSKSLNSSNGDEDTSKLIDGTPPRSRKNTQVQNDKTSNIDISRDAEIMSTYKGQVNSLAVNLDNKIATLGYEKINEGCNAKQLNNQNTLTNDALSNRNNIKNSIEMNENGVKKAINNQSNDVSSKSDAKKEQAINGLVANCHNSEVSNSTKASDIITITSSAATSTPALSSTPAKKEKLGGFLPNGCIFPRFTKSNKHKDKEKEPKTKEKERNVLLSALKKSKEKKSNVAANTDERITSLTSKLTAANSNNPNTKHSKNCLQQLECGVQKLELNNHHHANIVENNVVNSAPILDNNACEANKITSSTISSNDGVGVH